MAAPVSDSPPLWWVYFAQDFPGGPLVKNLPSKAGDVGSIPGQGTKIPQTARHLRPWAKTKERPECHNKDPVQTKKKRTSLPLPVSGAAQWAPSLPTNQYEDSPSSKKCSPLAKFCFHIFSEVWETSTHVSSPWLFTDISRAGGRS